MTTAWTPNCKQCGRQGIYRDDDANAMVECGCARVRSLWGRLAPFCVPAEQMEAKSLETFDRQREPEAFDAVNAWVGAVLSRRRPWMMLWGDNGTGKSHLACAAIRAIAEQNGRAVAISAPVLYEGIRESKRWTNRAPSVTEHDIRDVPVLLLDDFAADRLTEDLGGILFRVIDHRCMRALPTFLTTDVNLSAAEEVPGWRRVLDRIAERADIVKMKGTSRRWEMAKDRAAARKARFQDGKSAAAND